jgi:hypothetical protein
LYALGVGFVVVIHELDLIADAAGLDASGSVDLVAPEFESAVLFQRVYVQSSSLGDRESDGDGLLGKA